MSSPLFTRTCLARSLQGLRDRRRQAVLAPLRIATLATYSDRFPLYTPLAEEAPDSQQPMVIPRNRKDLLRQIKSLEEETAEIKDDISIAEKTAYSEEYTASLPQWEEEDYQSFYAALIASAAINPAQDHLGIEAPPDGNLISSPDEREEIIASALHRLRRSRAMHSLPEGSVDVARPPGPTSFLPHGSSLPTVLLEEIMASVPQDRLGRSSLEGGIAGLQSGLLTFVEADALLRQLLSLGEVDSARSLLRVAENILPAFVSGGHDLLLRTCGERGDRLQVGGHLEELETSGTAMPSQYHHLVVATLRSSGPYAAVRLLHHLEARSMILPMYSYGIVISSLLDNQIGRTQADKALGRDLFAHMRLMAYPIPSVGIYTSMISACADPADPQPERSLDLLTEMEEDSRLQPSGQTYTAAILACSRVKEFYAESFRLLSRMLEIHESAVVGGLPEGATSGFEPSIDTFNALLEGTKRTGDLSRARWILSELLKLASQGGDRPVTETMVNLFHTYAAFVPKVSRADVQQVTSKANEAHSVEEAATVNPMEISSQAEEDASHVIRGDSVFRHTFDAIERRSMSIPASPPAGPQSGTEALREAQRLFELLLTSSDAGSSTPSAFSEVKITGRLVNAYLSVHLAHAPLDKALEQWRAVWDHPEIHDSRLRKSGWSYLAVLERMGVAQSIAATRVVREQIGGLWREYAEWKEEAEARLEGTMGDGRERHLIGLGARQVERCHIAGIKAHVLIDDLTGALAIFKSFRDQYPAKAILEGYTRSPTFDNMIRVSSPFDIKEDNIPPHLLFHDIESLHQKLVIKGDLQGVGYLKWACTAYQAAIGKRRKMRMAEGMGVPKADHLIRGQGKAGRSRAGRVPVM